jgi:hypothetical protein
MGIDLREPISREEMERFAEDTMALWRTQYMLFLKAQAQGAPQGLIVEMADVSVNTTKKGDATVTPSVVNVNTWRCGQKSLEARAICAAQS